MLIALGITIHPWFWLGALAGIFIYYLRHIWRAWRRRGGFGAAMLAPLIITIVDIANGTGYIAGWWKRRAKKEQKL